MFVQKSTQKTIFDLDFNLPEKMLEKIKNTWAIVFRNTIMLLLIEAEKEYADLYSTVRTVWVRGKDAITSKFYLFTCQGKNHELM